MAELKPGGKLSGILPCERYRAAAIISGQMKSVSELNKRKVRLFVEAVLNDGRLELIEELVAADYVGHLPFAKPAVLGPQGVRCLVSSAHQAYPGLYIKVEDQIAEDDRVATRWQATTSVPDAHASSPPTEPSPRYGGISIVRLLAGKQVDAYTEYANLVSNATT